MGTRGWRRGRERGSALFTALILVSTLGILAFGMLAAGLDGQRASNGQADEHRLASAVESLGSLAAERVWTGYLRSQGGAAGTIGSFRSWLDGQNVPDSGPGGSPSATDGTDALPLVGAPVGPAGGSEFDRVKIDALRLVRRDEGDSTRLYITVSARTNRGAGFVTPALNRGIQIVYTVEPAPFNGFDYAILTNNVNCVFCHTVIDSTERAYNHDPAQWGTFDKVKVGTLESLMLRTDNRPTIGDFDADSLIAGTLYARGHATNQNGVPITAAGWGTITAQSFLFDSSGHLVQDAWGNLLAQHFLPAGTPPQPGANLYLDYPTAFAAQPDGFLPVVFPPPFPDDGGIDPATGQPTSFGANNKQVDPGEFWAVAQHAEGSITAGVIHLADPGDPIDTQGEYDQALFQGNLTSLPSVTHGNVILSGTQANPIVIDGTVAIEGDVVINGWLQGTGVILASGNLYIPTDLRYLDGHEYVPGDSPGHPTGPATYGVAQDGTPNALGLAAGGNMLVGDYLMPSVFTGPGALDIVTGGSDGPWNFALAEISLFNRTEWAHTQPFLPGPGEDHHDPSSWTVQNPGYIPGYMPRYYQFGPGDEIPIYNLGNLYYDAATGTWIGDAEVPGEWDPSKLTILLPGDTTNPLLYDPTTHLPVATLLQITPENGWLSDVVQEQAIESFKSQHPAGTPMQVDGLLYTNNAIFGIVHRDDPMNGQMVVNGSIVCADLGLLAPGKKTPGGAGNVPGSPYSVGLRLNYDERTKGMLNVTNPFQVTIKRTLWNPTANLL